MPPKRPKQHAPAREGAPESAFPNVYEGPEVLTALLQRAGSPYTAQETAERFRRAQAAGEERSDVIPSLFQTEPRFDAPEAARRLYGNLFALWDRIAAGVSIADDAPAVVPEIPRAPPPLPARGTVRGTQLTPGVVEAVWKHLDALSERERRRLRDRFEAAQPDLTAWLDALPLADEAAAAVQDLAFEAWAMFDVAFGDRGEAVAFRELRNLEVEPPALETSQPALAAYVAEALDLVSEESPDLSVAGRAQVERVMATLALALADALAPEDDA